jgi:hypothetical protein
MEEIHWKPFKQSIQSKKIDQKYKLCSDCSICPDPLDGFTLSLSFSKINPAEWVKPMPNSKIFTF